MRIRNLVTGLAVAMVAGAAILSLSATRADPVKMKLVAIEALGTPGSKAITIEFTRSELAGVRLDGDPSVQLRLANHWQDSLKLPQLDFLARTNQQTVVLAVPSETQACRFLVRYRVYPVHQRGTRSYCKVYFFLQRHGLRARFPKLSDLVLKSFVPRVRHTTLELSLPEEPIGHRTTSTGQNNHWVQAAPVCVSLFTLGLVPAPDCWANAHG